MQNNTINNKQTASLNRRILAMIVDLILMLIIMMPISAALNLILPQFSFEKINLNTELMLDDINLSTFLLIIYQSGMLAKIAIVQLVHITIIILIQFIFLIKFSTTPGKKLLKCLVVDATTGHKISHKQALYRVITMPFSLLILGIGLFMVEFTKNNQALHDKIANTLVILQK